MSPFTFWIDFTSYYKYWDIFEVEDHMVKLNKESMCRHCGYKSKLSANVKKHIRRIHMKATPFPCKFCTFKFKDKSDLQNHYKIKHGVVLRAREIDHLFMLSMITHIPGTTSVLCKICGYSSNSKPNVKRHVVSKHTQIRYPCQFCSATLSQEGDRRLHYQKRHGLTLSTSQIREMFENQHESLE
ncbi:hypothetical protein TCAL_16286 [Tigriopus californicus]|uniref:C2H2-type domain-containing protein n=1 Tax=Tigriopus californicus TaxID=6832 RepID=A0A553N6B6_TIGCA|nr:hypothetical protein TCAL_16286 [Tigriopus californicus]